jgi:hypothetical protein
MKSKGRIIIAALAMGLFFAAVCFGSGCARQLEPEEYAGLSAAEIYACTLSVRCDTLLQNPDLSSDKRGLVPADGVIFTAEDVVFQSGESVFDVLQRELRRARIHLEFTQVPLYNSAYIEGINNLYEFDGGELSGWMYRVNGWFPNYGCSLYLLQDGDKVEWVYTCDLGRDVGGAEAVN